MNQHALLEGAATISRLNGTPIRAADVPPITPEEASQLSHEALARFIEVMESLDGPDWQQPTACTEWTVRDILAHIAGACAGYASWGEWLRQFMFNRHLIGADPLVDGVNQRQIDDRAGRAPSELLAELRTVGPRGLRTRHSLPAFLRSITMDMGSPAGKRPFAFLLDEVYTRDLWMHRDDVCRATGRPFEQTAGHDGRIIALVLRDIASTLAPRLGGRTVLFDLVGEAGGRYLIGDGATPDLTIRMDVRDFNRMASWRLPAAEVIERGLAEIEGDPAFAAEVLAKTAALY